MHFGDKMLQHLFSKMKVRESPPLSGRTVLMRPGVLPTIRFASSPTTHTISLGLALLVLTAQWKVDLV